MGEKLIGQGTRPLICTPLVGQTKDQILVQLEQDILNQPDIIEWRADFFSHVEETDQVLDVVNAIKRKTSGLPVIFTLRSIREGGYPMFLTDREVIALNAEVCRKTEAEYVDCELSIEADSIRHLQKIASQNGKMLIGSFHDFNMMPSRDVLLGKITAAEQLGLNVAKVAVMPQSLEDVLTLLSVTLEAKKMVQLPLITIAMGKHGAVSRMIGGLFGSSLSFAAGSKSSAPGQIPIDDLKSVLDVIGKVSESDCAS